MLYGDYVETWACQSFLKKGRRAHQGAIKTRLVQPQQKQTVQIAPLPGCSQ